MEIAINSHIYQQAQALAQLRGLNLSMVIENFLVHFIGKNNEIERQEAVPDVVLSLLGAGAPIAEDDMNGREAYYQHLETKYK